MVYLISYDLIGKGEDDYPQLIEALKKDGAVRILYSEWLVQSNDRAVGVASRYAKLLDNNDRLFVCEVTQNSAYLRLQNEESAKKVFFPLLRVA